MVKVAIFASGNGSNFENLVLKLRAGKIKGIDIKLLLVDKRDIYAIERAKRLEIPYEIVEYRQYGDKVEYEREILKRLEKYEIEYILLAGYMKIIGDTILGRYDKKIINIHPSYLPYYRGKDSIKRAYENGEEFTGVTIHYVDNGVDTGEIIYQEKIYIDKDWDLDILESEVHKKEYEIYPKVLDNLFNNMEEK